VIRRQVSLEERERQRTYDAVREEIRSVVAATLAIEFGSDNVRYYDDRPFEVGVTAGDDRHFFTINIGGGKGEITLTPDPQDVPSLIFWDGSMATRVDIGPEFGGQYDRRTRALMQAVLHVAQEILDDMEKADA
jgi:hypothetical protein